MVLSSIPDPETPEELSRVRDAIEKFKGDVNQAVDFLFDQQMKEDDEESRMRDASFANSSTSLLTDTNSENSSAPNSPARHLLAMGLQTPRGSQSPSSSPPTDSGTEIPAEISQDSAARRSGRYATRKQVVLNRLSQTAPKAKRKETARERKERQKRESKERRQQEQLMKNREELVERGVGVAGVAGANMQPVSTSKIVYI